MNKRMKKKPRNKRKQFVMFGNFDKLLIPFWEEKIERLTKLLNSGIVRTSRARDRMQKKLDHLHYRVWEEKTSRKRRHEIMLAIPAERVPHTTIEQRAVISKKIDLWYKTPEVKYKELEKRYKE